ncbi:MmgE/PrpD family protein [Mycolicibacterium goodii]|uniref:MmgE/PrpD family protein n=1 Tax=Mycolicibacterium goodii TaxID=134601 RepID=UPI001BDD58F2|nr:MmgE/PrpD family protein [Mycolicibacterium goodii]MBU8812468.1 MmgE/PrpD family protein [Mycolicibacterium goodii]
MTSPDRTRLRGGPRTDQPTWKIAELAADATSAPAEVAAMVSNRIVDNAAVAAAAARRRSVILARAQARAHPTTSGAAIFGIEGAYSAEWAAVANGVAVNDLELHDVFPAADDTHPGATIPALTAVAQQAGLRGTDLIDGIATAYEVHIALAQGTPSQQRAIGHPGHLSTAVAAGLGTMLRLPPETIYTAITHAVQLTTVGRRCRRRLVAGRNGYAAAYAGKVAIEAVDLAMHGQRHLHPPEVRGDDGNQWLLPEYDCEPRLPAPGEPKTAILISCPRKHSAAYHGQVWIDLALRLRDRIGRLEAIESIVLHTRQDAPVAAGHLDPRRFDPQASRDTLAHSVVYLFAVALQDGAWHHEHSYAPERSRRADTIELCHQISTIDDRGDMAAGARATITMKSGAVIAGGLDVPDAHPSGAHPFQRRDYFAKFTELADGVIDRREQQRFLDVVSCLGDLKRGTLGMLNPMIGQHILDEEPITHGIFR